MLKGGKNSLRKSFFDEQNKNCWELFSIPTVNTLKYSEDNVVDEYEFLCRDSGMAFRVYCPKGSELSIESLSEIMNRGLSICHQCIQKKMDNNKMDN